MDRYGCYGSSARQNLDSFDNLKIICMLDGKLHRPHADFAFECCDFVVVEKRMSSFFVL